MTQQTLHHDAFERAMSTALRYVQHIAKGTIRETWIAKQTQLLLDFEFEIGTWPCTGHQIRTLLPVLKAMFLQQQLESTYNNHLWVVCTSPSLTIPTINVTYYGKHIETAKIEKITNLYTDDDPYIDNKILIDYKGNPLTNIL